jgi:hypothetical protein
MRRTPAHILTRYSLISLKQRRNLAVYIILGSRIRTRPRNRIGDILLGNT